MTYRELYENALYDLEHDKITLGEFWKMTEPLEKRVDAPTMSDWIPYPEQAPKEEKEYLISCKEGWVETRWYNPKEWSFFNVNAWMPLPEPYKG